MAKQLKYKIKQFVDQLPRSISIGSLRDILKKEHGISSDTFYRDCSLSIDDDFSIPSDRMDVYAALLSCTVDELKNFTSKKIKPLSQRKLSPTAKSVIKKAKLKK